MLFGQQFNSHRIFKRPSKALIRLRVCAGWSEALLVAHTTCWKSHVVAHMILLTYKEIFVSCSKFCLTGTNMYGLCGDWTLTLCILGNFSCFCCSMLTFSKLTFSKNSFRNTIRESNSLDPDPDRQNWSGSKLFAKGYQQMSKVTASKQRVKYFIFLFFQLWTVWVMSLMRMWKEGR